MLVRLIDRVKIRDYNPDQVLDKAAMKSLERQSKWNHFRSWPNLEALASSGYQGWITIRSLVRDSPYFVPEVAPGTIYGAALDLLERGAKMCDLYFQEIPNPPVLDADGNWVSGVRRHINFEVQRSLNHLWIRYGTGQCNLRHDLENNGIELDGFRAVETLRHYLGPDCMDELNVLLNEYPACIEGTRFTDRVGVFESELLIWEIRNF